jgi:hypothetical protein
MRIFFGTLIFLLILSVSNFAQSSKGTSIVIHDNTSKANGGENATSGLRSELESALADAKPCVDTMDDEDIRDVLQGERDTNMMDENSSPEQTLQDIGKLMGASYVMSVSSTPGAGGSSVYNVVVIDQSGKAIARAGGTNAKEVADNIVKQLDSRLGDNCKPHWLGNIKYEYNFNETKTTTDKGPMLTDVRNVKREKTVSGEQSNTTKVTILPPKSGSDSSASKVMASVWMRISSKNSEKNTITGEMRCRLPGQNPTWKGYNQTSLQGVTMLGAGAQTLPVFINFDDDGTYRVVVTTPSIPTLTTAVFVSSRTVCESDEDKNVNDGKDSTDKTAPGSFDFTGKTDPKNRNSLSGTLNLPDGHTKISWNLRLVKPKK